MMRSLLVVLFGTTSSIAAFGQAGAAYECTLGNLVRRVEIFYAPGGAVPCEVRYIKETEAPGTTEVLWNAQNESGYCEARTREFVARLGSLGWRCVEPVGAASGSRDEESATEDDTAVLSAPE